MKIRIIRVLKFLCYGCGLWYGDADELETPSDLCPSCKSLNK